MKKKLCIWLFPLLLLAACNQSNTTAVQDSFEAKESSVSNYHVSISINEFKNNQLIGQGMMNGNVDGDRGSATRIDKENNVVTNQISVVAVDSRAAVRYYQGVWEETVSPASSLMNAIPYSYAKVVNLEKSIASISAWEQKGEGFQLSFKGDTSQIREALDNFLGYKVASTDSVSLSFSADSDYRIRKVLIESAGVVPEVTRKTEIEFNGFELQKIDTYPRIGKK